MPPSTTPRARAAAPTSATRATARGWAPPSASGICHSYTPDGRCVSLLKILLTNFCIYDCLYCINRKSSDVRRARFTPEEVVQLTLDFYRRNYIEGLFLSSGIIRNADYTMEQVIKVARTLRVEHHFRGYIHLKTIPEAAPELIAEAGRWADRISINVELPTEGDLQQARPREKHRAHPQVDDRDPQPDRPGQGRAEGERQGTENSHRPDRARR